jgi:hypothetical protein
VIPYEPTEADIEAAAKAHADWYGRNYGRRDEDREAMYAVLAAVGPAVAARYYEQALNAAYDRIARPDVRGPVQAMKALRELGAAGGPAGEPQGPGSAAVTGENTRGVPAQPECCEPCPGRGTDGHGMEHCAECCYGTGVIADPECPTHAGVPAQPEPRRCAHPADRWFESPIGVTCGYCGDPLPAMTLGVSAQHPPTPKPIDTTCTCMDDPGSTGGYCPYHSNLHFDPPTPGENE